ncbi:tRNA (adenosine(37)-N6)-threonylcarbamoyltransferase complex ATPase subunit type 1 TsaE [Mesoplasma syrphidae]|uniref:tRNA threonylcarbamoyladenosine biosynthesis protein TsaE n=1 Tax=Mesoplasma syrphidae TaxID=225999 RepID=A0A2K9BVM4_9MOLU|nr:tRNA (adenosine(37)-N6)-threonylcarbamoyltransferase complex ATPase subunit type 1 TsaE [Mesoplasma syrphidae]AUF83770.1 tRNA (adenosine(37)-N6)-threonylcarbamoyltransferase complex ATPase subunit type 1 TsaE [Mesoplasma syrphidae]
METIILNDLSATKAFATKMAQDLKRFNQPNYLLLSGDLGAGKTTFSKYLLAELGVTQRVTSPTFVIMNQYHGSNNLKINHVDAYRLSNDAELEMYLEEFEDALNIIEWYENLNLDLKNIKYIKISIQMINENSRKVILERN